MIGVLLEAELTYKRNVVVYWFKTEDIYIVL